MTELVQRFGEIDIYLFDQLLRGNIAPGMHVLDAGCGGGRNLVYLLREAYKVFGVDANPEAIASVRSLAAALAPESDPKNFRVEAIEAMSFPGSCVDVVISNSVLHFARDDEQFDGMVWEMWRVMRAGGLFFCRLASTIGASFERVSGRRYRLPGGVEWYLVDENFLMRLTERLGGQLVDSLKTTVVQGSRCMTTWVVRKGF